MSRKTILTTAYTRIVRDSEWNEYIVEFLDKTQKIHRKEEDYHTDDKSDAIMTSNTWIHKMNLDRNK